MDDDGITMLPTGAAIRFDRGIGAGLLPPILIVHGWGSPVFQSSTYARAADRLNAVGYHTFTLSLRGHQCAEGEMGTVTRQEHAEDIMAAVYAMARPNVDVRRLCAWGTSYGAYLLASLVPQFGDRLKLLALRAPALYPDEGWDSPSGEAMRDMGALRSWRSVVHHALEDSRALRGITHFQGRLLAVFSENDEDMPRQVAASYQLAARQTLSSHYITLEGAGHVLRGEDWEKFLDVLASWFQCRYPANPSD